MTSYINRMPWQYRRRDGLTSIYILRQFLILLLVIRLLGGDEVVGSATFTDLHIRYSKQTDIGVCLFVH